MFNRNFIIIVILVLLFMVQYSDSRFILSSHTSNNSRKKREHEYRVKFNNMVEFYENLCGEGNYPIRYTTLTNINCSEIKSYNDDQVSPLMKPYQETDAISALSFILIVIFFAANM